MISQLILNREMRLMLILLVTIILPAPLMATEQSWPKQLAFDLGFIQLYEPSIDQYDGKNIEGRAAIAFKTGSPGTPPVFAAIRFSAISTAGSDTATIGMHDIELTGFRFGEGVQQDPNELIDALRQALQNLSLSVVRPEWMTQTSGNHPGNIDYDVPDGPINILLRTTPSVLVVLDGEPELESIDAQAVDTDTAWVINSNYPMLYQQGRYFLLITNALWYQSDRPTGPWSKVTHLPGKIRQLFNQLETDDPGTESSSHIDPEIIVATEPTDLLVSDGAPAWAALSGLNLLYMTNTDSDIFMDLQSGRHYVLLQDAWYTGLLNRVGSTWQLVGNDELPASFADIDVESPKAYVLAYVHGTPQARAAVFEDSLPRTQAVPRNDTSYHAEWEGEPQFESLDENTELEYAINTPDDVFRIGQEYYACYEGIWYISAAAFGPWRVALEIPDIIYEIPDSNPQHRVTYTRVYGVTPEFVYFRYTPAYLRYSRYPASLIASSGYRYPSRFSNRFSSPWNRGFQSYYDSWSVWAYVNPTFRPRHYRNFRYYHPRANHQRTRYRQDRKHHDAAGHRDHAGRTYWQKKAQHRIKTDKSGRHRMAATVNNDHNTPQRQKYAASVDQPERSRNQAPRKRAAIATRRIENVRRNGLAARTPVHQQQARRSTANRSGTQLSQHHQNRPTPVSRRYNSRPITTHTQRPTIALSERQGPVPGNHLRASQRPGNSHRSAAIGDLKQPTRKPVAIQNKADQASRDTAEGAHQQNNRKRESTSAPNQRQTALHSGSRARRSRR